MVAAQVAKSWQGWRQRLSAPARVGLRMLSTADHEERLAAKKSLMEPTPG
jgi:hypothetical protein